MISGPLVRYVLTAAMRDRLILTLMLMIGLGAGTSVFLGSASITEQDSFALVFGSGGLRFLSVIGLVLFCCFYVRRAFETKEVEFLLSRPLSRMTFLFSHAFSFALLAVLVAAVVAGAVYFLGKPNPHGLFAWGLSLGVENIIMTVAALFFSMVLSSAAGSALATLGLYVLARLIGMLIGIAHLPPENLIFAILNNTLEVISVAVPRLDLMGQTSWLVYGVEGSSGGLAFAEYATKWSHAIVETLGVAGFMLAQGVFFIALLLGASAFDFARRQF